MRSLREAYELLERRRASVVEGLVDRLSVEGGVALLSRDEVREAVRAPHAGLDVPAAELEAVARAAVEESAQQLALMLTDAAPVAVLPVVTAWLIVSLEEGYLLRAMQEADA